MELFFWIMMGILAGFMAKTTFPADHDENVLLLIGAATLAAVGAGFLMQTVFRTGFLGMSAASHIAAFVGATVVLIIMRIATTPRIPIARKPAPRRR